VKAKLGEREPEGVTLRLDAGKKPGRCFRKQLNRFRNPRQRAGQAFGEDVLVADAQPAVGPATAHLD